MHRTLITAIVAALLASAGVASADDGKTYPGAACMADTAGIDHSWGRAIHDSKYTHWFECPAVKDGSNIRSAWVRVIDRHYSKNAVCRVHSMSSTSASPSGWWQQRSTSGSSTSPQALIFPALPAYSTGHYFVACEMPPRYSGNPSVLVAYNILERD